MGQGHNYIATWFYRESHEEASFYPQAGGRGDSELLHSVYMQIQVPFFTTFRHYNPQARMNQHYLYDILDESSFWKKAEVWCGVPSTEQFEKEDNRLPSANASQTKTIAPWEKTL